MLLVAAFLSMVIGLDRQHRNQPAGLRTHMLVGVGACLFTILSSHAFPRSETARVAAQIVSGIGFLGAGTILQRKGLTTAASIWATAAVGMAVGVGAWFLAIAATVLIWVVLAIFRRFKVSNGDNITEAEESASEA
jgi:putative Mg2+ transporter-C (MgtC) family protein